MNRRANDRSSYPILAFIRWPASLRYAIITAMDRPRERTRCCGRQAVGAITSRSGAKVFFCFDHFAAMSPLDRARFSFNVDVCRIGPATETCQMALLSNAATELPREGG